MSTEFTPVTLDGREAFMALWRNTPRRSLDYTLANIWGWQEYYGLEWHFTNNLCWLRQTKPSSVLWAPVGNWNSVDWPAAFKTLARAPQCCDERCFARVPEELLRIWQSAMPGIVQAEEARGQWEYLYKREELATLPGNRFHKKRNHYNGYIKAYGEPDYRPLNDAMVEDVLAVQDDWCQWHDCEESPSLRAENDAINRVLSHWDCFCCLTGGSLYVDGIMVAFSIGEKLDEQSMGVHYEKGLSGYRGVYQTINSVFVQQAGSGFAYINRAQDLDEEGLRQAKLTYLPTDFLRKYTVRIPGM